MKNNAPAVLPLARIRAPPSNDIFHRSMIPWPANRRIGRDGPFHPRHRRRRCAGQRRQRGDVQRRHLAQIGKVHPLDGVAIFDAAFGPQILVLPIVILDRDRHAHRREAHVVEGPVMPATAESLFQLNEYCSTGVCPLGDQVRQRCGRWLSPLSSMNTMVRLSCRAFF